MSAATLFDVSGVPAAAPKRSQRPTAADRAPRLVPVEPVAPVAEPRPSPRPVEPRRSPQRQPVEVGRAVRRQPVEVGRGVRRVTTFAVLVVAVVAAIASFDHQRELAALAGEGWRAWLLPLSVDGLVVAASMSMLVRRRAGLPAGALAWFGLVLGCAASLAANVASAEPTLVGRLVAAWPPVALLVGYELLMRQVGER